MYPHSPDSVGLSGSAIPTAGLSGVSAALLSSSSFTFRIPCGYCTLNNCASPSVAVKKCIGGGVVEFGMASISISFLLSSWAVRGNSASHIPIGYNSLFPPSSDISSPFFPALSRLQRLCCHRRYPHLNDAMEHHHPSSFPLPAKVLNMAMFELPLTLESAVKLPHTADSSHIPRLGFGLYLSPPEATKTSVLKALKYGYRHFDTAQYYENESQLGEAIRKSGVERKDVFITTKILMRGGSVEKSLEKCWESVRRIGCGGYVNLFLIHSPSGGKEARKELWKALEMLMKEGGTKAIGVSN